jgi:hypothetical protein
MEDEIQTPDGVTLAVMYQVTPPDEMYGYYHHQIEILDVYDADGGEQSIYSILRDDVIDYIENELYRGRVQGLWVEP